MTFLHNLAPETITAVLEQMLPGHELEWRLGQHHGERFESSVPAAERLLEHYKFTHASYSVLLYANGVRVRDGRAERKSRIAHADFEYRPLGARLSLASEEATAPPRDEIPTGTREIERWTATLGAGELMVSRVNGRWEVEIEFKRRPTAAAAVAALTEIMQRLVTDRPNMVLIPEIRTVAAAYNQYWHDCAAAGFLRRVGRKPLNFTEPDCEALLARPYSVSNKLDGSKYTMITHNGDVYAVSEVDAIWLAHRDDAPDAESYDGEWDPHDQTLQLFDHQRRDAAPYRERMAQAARAVKQLAIPAVQCKQVDHSGKAAQATRATIAAMRKRYGKAWAERNDGIIYTPEDVAYLAGEARELRTLKWKFPDKISIDLRLQRDGDHYRALAATREGEAPVAGVEIAVSDAPELDGVIAEVGLDAGEFYVMRLRPDKTHPNFITVVTETLRDMRAPLSLERLEKLIARRRGGYVRFETERTETDGGAEQSLIPMPDDALLTRAREYVATDRAMFSKLTAAVLEYAVTERMRLSNPEALLDETPTVVNLYAADGLRTANNLANLLYAVTPIIYMKTVIPYAEFEISALNRAVARIYVYPRVRHIRTEQLFRAVPVTIAGHQLETLHREIELIAIYHRLYQPFPDRWPAALALETVLWRADGGATGGAPPKTDFARAVRQALYDSMEFNDLGVLVGHWGWHELSAGQTVPQHDKIQILSADEPEAMRERVERIMRDTTPVRLQWKTEEVHIPGDMHLRRTTYYYDWQGKRTPLFDQYNSLEYEIVPTCTGRVKKLRCGNPYVLQRFFLIDLWTINVLAAGNYITEPVAAQKRVAMLAAVDALRAPEYRAMCAGDEYVGCYKDQAIERRRALKAEEKFHPYKPLEYFERTGHLRAMK